MGPQHAQGPCKSTDQSFIEGFMENIITSAVSWNRPVPARGVEFFRVIKCSKSVPVRTDIFNSHNYNTKQLTKIRTLKFRQRVLCQVVVVVSSIFQWYVARADRVRERYSLFYVGNGKGVAYFSKRMTQIRILYCLMKRQPVKTTCKELWKYSQRMLFSVT